MVSGRSNRVAKEDGEWPLAFASGRAATPEEREREENARHNSRVANIERYSSYLRACKIMGIPAKGSPSLALRRLWARMTGERDEVA